MTVLALVLSIGLAMVHIFATHLRLVGSVPRSRWLSFAGGGSVAYVFVHILPDLAEHQEALRESKVLGIDTLDHHIYLIALVGLASFYGLERLVRGSLQNATRAEVGDGDESPVDSHVFWLHIASFAIYNALVGYLLVHREGEDRISVALFGVAMGFHFLVNDFGLEQDHRDTYSHTARWILAVAVLAGWVAGVAFDVGEASIAVLFALLAGSIILNVLKEELPQERESRFIPFALGVTIFAAVLLAA